MRTASWIALALAVASSLTACRSNDTREETSRPEQAVAAPSPQPAAAPSPEGDYFERVVDGRLYVLGSGESLVELETSGELPYQLVKIGEGPDGQTVVLEAECSGPELQDRLWAEFQLRHPFYAEVTHDGRIHVLGSRESLADFHATHEVPYSRSFIGEGPGGETVVVEIDPDDPALVERLVAEFGRRHGVQL